MFRFLKVKNKSLRFHYTLSGTKFFSLKKIEFLFLKKQIGRNLANRKE